MATQDNIKIARQLFDAWNAHDPDGYVKLLDANHVMEGDGLPTAMVGHQAAKQFMQVYVTAFPDLRFELTKVLGDGDYVTVQYTATGTHRGDLMGIPPTNKKATVRGCSLLEIRNGKTQHEWLYWDNAHLLRQLGVMK